MWGLKQVHFPLPTRQNSRIGLSVDLVPSQHLHWDLIPTMAQHLPQRTHTLRGCIRNHKERPTG